MKIKLKRKELERLVQALEEDLIFAQRGTKQVNKRYKFGKRLLKKLKKAQK